MQIHIPKLGALCLVLHSDELYGDLALLDYFDRATEDFIIQNWKVSEHAQDQDTAALEYHRIS